MKKALSLLVTLVVSISLAPAFARDNYPRSTVLDALHYRIRIDIADQGDEIQGETEIVFAMAEDGVKSVSLDFAGLKVEQVTENGRAANFTHADGRLTVTIAAGYKRGDRVRISIKYHGKPQDGLFIKKNKFNDRTIFADNWPNRARYWFPSIDHPYDKATVEFFVTAPDGFDVIANGALVETTSLQNKRKLSHWRESVPIPTYCMVIGATEFSIINAGSWAGIPVIYYLYPKDRERGIKDYGRAVEMLEFYTNLIGPYPYEKLALVESSTRFGGMENSSNIFFDEKRFNGSGSLEGTVAHEIAHQWFGDSVTEGDWHHLWLSEGFATYFENLFFERADGREKFVRLMLNDKETYLKANRANSRPIHDQAITDLFKLLNANNYQKGGWVLHMLRHVVGDTAFFAAIRDYYMRFRDRNAMTIDFQHVVEAHANQKLDWFFDQWIYKAGHPIYDAHWRWDEAAKELRLTVTQKQEQTVFRMPLDVVIRTGERMRLEIIQMNEREQTFTFKLDQKPRAVAIDPDEWVLKELRLEEAQ
ncbi:MAG TPA: M1 family aminopeptidase [Blastocatellia bacterium]|nr:M1 family aminopeptidase [Blastocatellia bacterium]